MNPWPHLLAHQPWSPIILWQDVDSARLARAAPRLAKAGVDNVEQHVIAPGADKWLKRRKRSFDRVLVDAPCSGVGAWRRNPDARGLRRTRPLDELLPVQADVLQRAARLVRPGGMLVYATCSLLQDENEEQVCVRHTPRPRAAGRAHRRVGRAALR
jgi:16S rRNA (cytosine967-C5)-methyltransferase